MEDLQEICDCPEEAAKRKQFGGTEISLKPLISGLQEKPLLICMDLFKQDCIMIMIIIIIVVWWGRGLLDER